MKIAANALIPIVVLRGRFNRAAWPPRPAAGLDVTSQSCNASERRWTNSKSSKDLDLETKAKIWSSLSCICHIRSTADAAHGVARSCSLVTEVNFTCRCRAKVAHIRQSRPVSELGFHLKPFKQQNQESMSFPVRSNDMLLLIFFSKIKRKNQEKIQ